MAIIARFLQALEFFWKVYKRQGKHCDEQVISKIQALNIHYNGSDLVDKPVRDINNH